MPHTLREVRHGACHLVELEGVYPQGHLDEDVVVEVQDEVVVGAEAKAQHLQHIEPTQQVVEVGAHPCIAATTADELTKIPDDIAAVDEPALALHLSGKDLQHGFSLHHFLDLQGLCHDFLVDLLIVVELAGCHILVLWMDVGLEGGLEGEDDLNKGCVWLHGQFGVDQSSICHELQGQSGDEIARYVIVAPISPLHL